MDNNSGENSLIVKRNQLTTITNQVDSSKNAQRRLKSPKNSSIAMNPNKGGAAGSGQTKKVTLKQLGMSNPMNSAENVATQFNFKN